MDRAQMLLPDVNVLVHALSDDGDHHEAASDWVENARSDHFRFALVDWVLTSTVRILSNARTFGSRAVDPAAILDRLDVLRAAPNAVVLHSDDRTWRTFRALCAETGARGPLIEDVWLAALAIEHGCTLVTFDRHFARFPGLRWRRPGD